MKTYTYNYKQEEKQNNFIGFTSFNHYDNESLFTDVVVDVNNKMLETEDYECFPVPQGVMQNGREQGYHPDSTIAYFRILWKDFEPNQNEFNFSFVQDILDNAKKHNQSVMFRLMPHSTNKRDDVPEWLKSIISCPIRYDGLRVKDSPIDNKFLFLFAKAVKAFADKFDSNPVLDTMDISVCGAWGEGEGIEKYAKEDIEFLVNTFVDNFKSTKLIGQIGMFGLVAEANKIRPVGWRADGIGKPYIHEKLYSWAVPIMPQNAWEKAPISFEAFWWISEWKRQGWDIDAIIEFTLKHHISSFNNKNFPIPYSLKPKIDYWLSKMGYHFTIKKLEVFDTLNKTLKLNLTIENSGVAPLYNKIPLKIALISNVNYVFFTDIDVTTFLTGTYENEININLKNVKNGNYKIGLSISDENNFIYLANDIKKENGFYILGDIDI